MEKIEPDSQVIKLIKAKKELREMMDKCRGLEKQLKAKA